MRLRVLAASTLFFVAARPSLALAQTETSISIASVTTSTYPAISVDVDTPPGAAGAGLAPGAFEVFENGKKVEVSVSRTIDSGLEVMLLVDTSGSMLGAPIAAARKAAADFALSLPAEAQVGLITFGGDGVRVLTPPVRDHSVVIAQLSTLRATGDTPLYDAVVTASSAFTPTARTRTVVVLSDGADQGSASPLGDAVAAAANAQVEVIELVTPQSNRVILEQLATAGHGHLSSADDPAALAGAYRAVSEALFNRYQLNYRSSGSGDTRLLVRLAAPTGVLQTSISIGLPALAVAPPTTATESTPPATAVVSEATQVTTASIMEPVQPARPFPVAAGILLTLGALAAFGAIYLIALFCLPRALAGRVSRRQLGLPTRKTPSLSDASTKTIAAVDAYLARSERGGRVAAALDAAGIAAKPGEYVVIAIVVAVASALIGSLLGGPVAGLLFAGLAVFASYGYVSVKRQRRRAAFAEGLPEVLQLLTTSLRSGYGLVKAIDVLAEEAAEPAATLLQQAVVEMRLGRDITDTLRAIAERMDSADFGWVASAVDIHREVGGNLAEVFENVGRTIRDRQKLTRQIATLTAEGRLSAVVLTGMPIAIGLFMKLRNPDYFDELNSAGGRVVLLVAGGLIVVGWVWMRRLMRFKY